MVTSELKVAVSSVRNSSRGNFVAFALLHACEHDTNPFMKLTISMDAAVDDGAVVVPPPRNNKSEKQMVS
jgi:hypothetical protein